MFYGFFLYFYVINIDLLLTIMLFYGIILVSVNELTTNFKNKKYEKD